MSTIGGKRQSPSHHMLRDAMRQLYKEFPCFRPWPLLGINGRITWPGLIVPEWFDLTPVNDNNPRHH